MVGGAWCELTGSCSRAVYFSESKCTGFEGWIRVFPVGFGVPCYTPVFCYTSLYRRGGGYFPLGSRYVLVSALCSRGWVLDWRGVVMCRVSRCWRVVAYETIGKGTPVG